ncbi:MAG TPA: hypothetical protein VH120_17680 [Gemmataceae bacterium]|nr:hypothetical protein [Gemmataceae bacterium]
MRIATCFLFITCAILPAADPDPIRVRHVDGFVLIDTDRLQARINSRGYVSGIAAGSFLDKQTGARDLGSGLHVMDFLLAPGWRDDGYERGPKVHGNLPKHYVEGPQLCTQAKELTPEVLRGDGFVAVRLRFTYSKPGNGYKAGSTWEQTLVFQPGVRFVLSAERVTCVNDVENLFYRIDMPGHVKHHGEDTFSKVYLSYLGKPIPASEFNKDFAPDAKYLYQRKEGRIPQRMIRAYQVKMNGKPGPWLAGVTLDPAAVCEAWCHERGYVCFIEELHGRPVRAGETIGAAYAIGWFDDIPEMERVADQHRGVRAIEINGDHFRPVRDVSLKP